MKIHIVTERLIIRDIEDLDVTGIYDLYSDPDVHTYLLNRPIKTVDEAKEIIGLIRKQYKEYGISRWAIIDKGTNDFIGWAGLKYEQKLRKDFTYYDLGFRLKKKYWGKGIGTESAVESLKYGFSKLDLNEICAAAHIENVASNKILKNIGLKFIETFEYDGELHNWYKIYKTEWIEENPTTYDK